MSYESHDETHAEFLMKEAAQSLDLAMRRLTEVCATRSLHEHYNDEFLTKLRGWTSRVTELAHETEKYAT